MSLLDIYPGMVGLKLEACRQYHYTVHQLLDQPLFLKKKNSKTKTCYNYPCFPTKQEILHKLQTEVIPLIYAATLLSLHSTSLHSNKPLRPSKHSSTFFPANPVGQLHSPKSCTQKQPLQYTQFQPTLLAPRCKQYCFVCTF